MANRQSDEKSRAEQVRGRRQKSRKETQVNPYGNSASRKKTINSATVSRRPSSTAQIVNRKRRKVHVPLKSKGAELQLPAFLRLKFGWRAISGAIFVLSLVVIICFSNLSTFEVSAVNLKGAERLSGEEILSKVDLVGDTIITVQPEAVKASIETGFPSLSSVDVSVGLPASVSIQVTERQPLVLWQFGSASYWIDAEGILFTPHGEAEVFLTVSASAYPPAAPDPVVTEEEIEEENTEGSEELLTTGQPVITRTTPEFVQGILALKAYIPEGSMLQYDPEFGLGWQDPNGWMVYFGKDITEMVLKLKEYQTIVETLSAQNIVPALISLEFIDAPFYRLEH